MKRVNIRSRAQKDLMNHYTNIVYRHEVLHKLLIEDRGSEFCIIKRHFILLIRIIRGHFILIGLIYARLKERENNIVRPLFFGKYK